MQLWLTVVPSSEQKKPILRVENVGLFSFRSLPIHEYVTRVLSTCKLADYSKILSVLNNYRYLDIVSACPNSFLAVWH